MSNANSGDIGVLVFFLIIGSLFSSSFFKSGTYNKKSFYFEYCDDFTHNTFSCPKDRAVNLMKRDFIISVENQKVLERSILSNKLRSCIVYDVGNWKCEKDSGGGISVNNGHFSEDDNNNNYLYQSIDENGQPDILPIYRSIPRVQTHKLIQQATMAARKMAERNVWA